MDFSRRCLIALFLNLPLVIADIGAHAQVLSARPSTAQSGAKESAAKESEKPKQPLESVVVEPSVLFPGQQYTLLLSLPKDMCAETDKNGANLLDGLDVRSSSPDALAPGKFAQPVGKHCETTLPATVGKDAPAGKVTLFLVSKPANPKTSDAADPILGQVSVTIQLQKGPGAIPAGLEPSLDLMWKVLPRRAVADSFGNRVADGYFEIEAVLGNETGYDLQLSAVGFDVPQVYCRPIGDPESSDALDIRNNDPSWDHCVTHDKAQALSTTIPPQQKNKHAIADPAILPVDAYPVVRGTVEREQYVGTRAFVVNLVKGASSVLVGVGGFYADAGTFVRSTGIISGPFEKALELVYPDLTTSHLINLDTRTLRDGVIVPNNTSFRINAFISREIVQCNYPKHLWQFGFTPHSSWYCTDDDGRLPWSRDFDSNQVMQRLGKLNLVGRKIQFLERERVLTRTDNLPQSQGWPVLSTSAIAVNRSSAQQFNVSGTNLHGAALKSSATCLKITNPSVTADETSLQFALNSRDCKEGDPLQLQIGTSHGFFLLNVSLAPPAVTTTDRIDLSKPSPFTINGASLWDASVTSDPDLGISKVTVDPKGEGGELTFEVDPTKVVAGGKCTLTVKTPAGSATTRPTAESPASATSLAKTPTSAAKPAPAPKK